VKRCGAVLFRLLQVKLKPCGGCRQVQYCSAGCQREDWHAGHKAVCAREGEPAEGAAEDGPSADPEQPDEKTTGEVRASPPPAAALPAEMPSACGLCNKGEGPLRACSRCKAIMYCSQACQRADWRRHKRVCVPREARLALG
jgi:hypothetical protein